MAAASIEDLEGIRHLHARYGDAVFRKDRAAFTDCWTPDAEWRIAGMVIRGRDDIWSFFERATQNSHFVLMTFRTPLVERIGAEARSRVYVTEQNAFKDGRPGSTVGTYFEKLVPQGSVWRRSWALFQLHYMGPADLTGVFIEQADYGPPPGFPPADAVPPGSRGG